MIKPSDMIDHSGLISLEPVLRTAYIKTLSSWTPAFKNLPMPVRFRASGALHAWQAVFDALPCTAAARRAIMDPTVPVLQARIELMKALQSYTKAPLYAHDHVGPLLQTLFTASSDMLAFWLRPSALYEPTLSLSSLLGGVDMSQDLPMSLLQPPNATLCIVPPWQQRHLCGNANVVMVFTHDATPVQHPAKRAFTLLALRPVPDGFAADELTMPVKDENATLADCLTYAANATRRNLEAVGAQVDIIDPQTEKWKQVLDYTVKVLLYLNLDQATVRQCQPWTNAPKEFPGLGRRKRDEKLAQINQLYDRYIVGPATVAEWAGEHAGELGVNGQLSPHWRRGHFRMQVHGPYNSLRKLIYQSPILICADKLSEAPPFTKNDKAK